MRKNRMKRFLALVLTGTLAAGTLTGCTFGFASDPDDPNETEEEIPIDTSVDTYEYRTDLGGTSITLLNSKAEIQVALAEEKAEDLTDEPWTAEAEGYLTEVNGKVCSFPLCIEGRGLIYHKAVIEEALGETFDPASIRTQDDLTELLDRLVAAGIEKPVSLAKEDWSLGAHQLQYVYETYDGTTEGAQQIIEQIKSGELDLSSYDRMNGFLDLVDILKK